MTKTTLVFLFILVYFFFVLSQKRVLPEIMCVHTRPRISWFGGDAIRDTGYSSVDVMQGKKRFLKDSVANNLLIASKKSLDEFVRNRMLREDGPFIGKRAWDQSYDEMAAGADLDLDYKRYEPFRDFDRN